jgi:predicted transcriptional regulator
LITFDRSSSHTLTITQELIAGMLGVRREGITQNMKKLKSEELIHNSRGRVTLLDRPGLEKYVCECYDVVNKEYQRLITDIPKHDPEHILGPSTA